MAEKALSDLPAAYSNLGYDAESEAGPSAPPIFDDSKDGDDAESEAGPSAPPIFDDSKDGDFQQGSSRLSAPPPPYVPRVQNDDPPQMVYDPPSLVFEEIFDACVLYVKDHCCYGSKFVKQMKLTEIHNKAVYHYILESFGEKRETDVLKRPYKGGPIDGPDRGPSPQPWDMTVAPPVLFKDSDTIKGIPHTESIHTCYKCNGRGKVTCDRCSGRGKVSCSRCSGSGRVNDGSCPSCHGSKKQRCSRCSGKGIVKCSRCDGYGKLIYERVLIVTWKNHVSNFVTNTEDMPRELMLNSEGIKLHEYQDFTVPPILNAADETVNAASVSLVQQHLRAFPNEMIIRQRHTLRALPFTRVKYQWKDREGEFYVYGMGRQVYFDEYPQRCCCCTCC